MRFFDFFAGIGGFRLGMEMAGHECVGHCEIDKWANMSYEAMHHPKESEVFLQMCEQLSLPICQSANVTVSDFHARLLALMEKEKDSEILEELYFLKSCGLLKSESLKYYSRKMWQDCLTTMGGQHSEQSSTRWPSWGILWNGKCLTANIMFRSTGNEYSLSDILETEVDEKYFLSQKTIARLMSYKDAEWQTP